MRALISILLLCIAMSCWSQQFSPTYQSNEALNFQTFLSGVKYAYLELSDEQLEKVKNSNQDTDSLILEGIIQYLNSTGFERVDFGDQKSTPQNYPSRCQLTIIKPYWNVLANAISEINMEYNSCQNDVFLFSSKKRVPIQNEKDVSKEVSRSLKQLHGTRKPEYNSSNKLSLKGEQTAWNTESLSNHFLENGITGIEGIYESAGLTQRGERLMYGVIKNDQHYNIVYLSGANNYLDWTTGEIQAKIFPTASEYIFKSDWILSSKISKSSVYLNFDTGQMMSMEGSSVIPRCIKIFPTAFDLSNKKSAESVSGSGFAVSKDGSFVTSYHVIEGADSIFVTLLNGSVTNRYLAKLVLSDRSNDIAILKIEDANFYGLNEIPYQIAKTTCELGNSVFVLGYPMRSTMGEQIKLTTGIVSAKSGFKDDVTNYQISAAVQPGNSGGPVFSQSGELIGIVSARHSNAENVSYAVKIQYLFNLIDSYQGLFELTDGSNVNNQNLTSTVKSVSPFVVIVEAYKSKK